MPADKLTTLTERQKKAFIAMYKSNEYTTTVIAARFGISDHNVGKWATRLGLQLRSKNHATARPDAAAS